jgi:hypothetical protein
MSTEEGSDHEPGEHATHSTGASGKGSRPQTVDETKGPEKKKKNAFAAWLKWA